MASEKTLINDMSQGPVLSKLFRFALPIMLANLLQAVYSMVDMIIVGQFCGAGGLSAVGIGGQISFLFLGVGMGLGNGGQVVISQQVGMKSEKISKTVGTMITLLFLCALVIGAAGVIFHNPILDLLNTPPAARSNAAGYLVICSCGMVFIYEYNAICAVLRGMGESRLPLVFIAVASVINIVLDLLFVGLFRWEAAGAAAATDSSSFFISSRSVSLKAPIRFIMPSQSTSWPSNSGPSTHTNFVLPPTLTRQAPHIPVPSTMMVLSDTSVEILYF